jgi:hypothetical protein
MLARMAKKVQILVKSQKKCRKMIARTIKILKMVQIRQITKLQRSSGLSSNFQIQMTQANLKELQNKTIFLSIKDSEALK